MPVIFFTNRLQLSEYHVLGDVLVHLARKEDKLTEQRGIGCREI